MLLLHPVHKLLRHIDYVRGLKLNVASQPILNFNTKVTEFMGKDNQNFIIQEVF